MSKNIAVARSGLDYWLERCSLRAQKKIREKMEGQSPVWLDVFYVSLAETARRYARAPMLVYREDLAFNHTLAQIYQDPLYIEAIRELQAIHKEMTQLD